MSNPNHSSDSPDSPIQRFRAPDADMDSVIDVHGVFRVSQHDIDVPSLPDILCPRSGSLGIQDWEKVWTTGPDADIFTDRGISDQGAIVIVRPDQYVAHVMPLTAREELSEFFDGFLVEQRAAALR